MKPSFVDGFLKGIAADGLSRSLRAVERLSPRESVVEGHRCVDFSSNDYLGLSFREELKESAIRWTERSGVGSGASRLVSGSSKECLELEERIAAWKGFEAALILGSGYAANVGAIQALARRGSAVFADKLNHASLNQGCILSQADFKRYRHCDAAHLKDMLAKGANDGPLIVSDTVFSMDGDVAPLEELRGVSHESQSVLYLDDAHATGVFGERGQGLASASLCDVALGTFSKAMGAYGACLACSKEMKEFLVNKCGPFIFSTALPPPVLGSISAAVELVQTEESAKARLDLLSKAASLRGALREKGFDTGLSSTMIIPVTVGDAAKALALSRSLLEKGVFAVAIRPPTVPQGSSRLRLSLNAAHTSQDVELLVSALTASAKKMDLI